MNEWGSNSAVWSMSAVATLQNFRTGGCSGPCARHTNPLERQALELHDGTGLDCGVPRYMHQLTLAAVVHWLFITALIGTEKVQQSTSGWPTSFPIIPPHPSEQSDSFCCSETNRNPPCTKSTKGTLCDPRCVATRSSSFSRSAIVHCAPTTASLTSAESHTLLAPSNHVHTLCSIARASNLPFIFLDFLLINVLQKKMADPTTQVEATQPEVPATAAEPTTETAPPAETTQDEPVKADQAEEAAATEENGETSKENDGTKEDKDTDAQKPRGHGHHDSNNRKYDASVLSVTNDPQTIRNQVGTQSRGIEAAGAPC